MSNNASAPTAGGVGFLGLLAVAFIVLRLCGVIDWPWIWVLLPLWGPVALVVVVGIPFCLFCLVMALLFNRD